MNASKTAQVCIDAPHRSGSTSPSLLIASTGTERNPGFRSTFYEGKDQTRVKMTGGERRLKVFPAMPESVVLSMTTWDDCSV